MREHPTSSHNDEQPLEEYTLLVFIVPVQSKRVSKCWTTISQLVQRCVASCLQQESSAFHVFLVCNDIPVGLQHHPQLTIISEDFPVPGSRGESGVQLKAAGMDDKWTKVKRALTFVRPMAPCHVMVVDSDDCVSNRLAALTTAHPNHWGWYIETGYVLDESVWRLYKVPSFYRLCGTSSIIRCTSQDLVPDGNLTCCAITDCGHTGIVNHFQSRGTPLSTVPFVGAVYITGHMENHSGLSYAHVASRRKKIVDLLRRRPLSPRVSAEFGLYRIPPENA